MYAYIKSFFISPTADYLDFDKLYAKNKEYHNSEKYDEFISELKQRSTPILEAYTEKIQKYEKLWAVRRKYIDQVFELQMLSIDYRVFGTFPSRYYELIQEHRLLRPEFDEMDRTYPWEYGLDRIKNDYQKVLNRFIYEYDILNKQLEIKQSNQEIV